MLRMVPHLYSVSAAHTSIFRMDSNSTSCLPPAKLMQFSAFCVGTGSRTNRFGDNPSPHLSPTIDKIFQNWRLVEVRRALRREMTWLLQRGRVLAMFQSDGCVPHTKHVNERTAQQSTQARKGYHQPPEVNCIEAIAKVDFCCRLNSRSLVCRGIPLLRERGTSSFEVAGGTDLISHKVVSLKFFHPPTCQLIVYYSLLNSELTGLRVSWL